MAFRKTCDDQHTSIVETAAVDCPFHLMENH